MVRIKKFFSFFCSCALVEVVFEFAIKFISLLMLLLLLLILLYYFDDWKGRGHNCIINL